MCGIVGIASAYPNGFTKAEADVFCDMLFLDTMRGFDSTGVFGVDYVGNVQIHKEASHSLDFMQRSEFKEFRTKLIERGLFAVGHNRAATRGSIEDKNAHPFWVDDKIILVQNGTYKGDHTHHKNTEVDTEAVAHVIAEHDDVATALQKVNASFALCWYNVEEKSINIIRNFERPMYTLELSTGAFIWASEANFLYMAASRNGLKYAGKAEELPTHTLLQLTIENKKWKKTLNKIDSAYRYPVNNHTKVQEVEGDTEDMFWVPEQNRVLALPHNYQQQQQQKVQQQSSLPKSPRTPAVKPDVVDCTIAERLPALREDLGVPRKLAIEVAETVNSYSSNTSYAVELVDYVPANSHSNCTHWHVWGHITSPGENKEEKAVVHWIERDKSEEEIIQMCGRFYFCKFGTIKTMLHDTDSFVFVLAREHVELAEHYAD